MEPSTPHSSTSKRNFWQQHILDCRKSGMSQHSYCLTHGLALSTYGYWKRKLSESIKKKTQFYPLAIQTLLPETGSVEKSNMVLQLAGDRFRIELGEHFSAATLKRLIVTLEQI